jgi:hypothetical protein
MESLDNRFTSQVDFNVNKSRIARVGSICKWSHHHAWRLSRSFYEKDNLQILLSISLLSVVVDGLLQGKMFWPSPSSFFLPQPNFQSVLPTRYIIDKRILIIIAAILLVRSVWFENITSVYKKKTCKNRQIRYGY